MSRPRLALVFALPLLAVAAGVAAQRSVATQSAEAPGIGDTRASLSQARVQGAAARLRAEKLEAEAARVTEAAERTAREGAALAARIQQAEAEIAGHEARARLIATESARLRARLAERQQPLVRLTAALQRLSRLPPVLGLLRPGAMRETVYSRALLATMLPQVERRTAGLRGEIARVRALQDQARLAAAQLRESEVELRARRRSLVALEARQRLESREATGSADREAERALALAEEARDLAGLVEELREAGAMREQLARLPGPILRPTDPGAAQVATAEASAAPLATIGAYLLPVAGELVTGFGDVAPGQPRARGITLAPRPGAQAVAPAPGRVAFAGPYRGYGNIVILEHAGGWTTLVTGLAQLDARVGARVLAGSPLGLAGPGRPRIGVELRREGTPVNPLDYARAL